LISFFHQLLLLLLLWLTSDSLLLLACAPFIHVPLEFVSFLESWSNNVMPQVVYFDWNFLAHFVRLVAIGEYRVDEKNEAREMILE
jgi:hypothetical protein